MKTNQIIPGCTLSREITGISADCEKVHPGEVYFALARDMNKRTVQITKALEAGASLIVCHEDTRIPALPENIIHRTSEPLRLLDLVLKNFYLGARKKPALVAVTGTNGKTSTAYYIYQMLNNSGRRAAFIGTIGGLVNSETHSTKLTTPDICDFYKFLHAASAADCETVAFEYSSHALHQKRLLDITIPYATFTNLTQDHLDYHGTMEEYFQAKRLLFTQHLGDDATNFAFLNLDDSFGQRLNHDPEVKRVKIGYGQNNTAAFRIIHQHILPDNSTFTAQWKGRSASFKTKLLGTHNVYNIAAACVNVLHLGMQFDDLPEAVSKLTAVPGRFENVPNKCGLRIIVDYAHTPDALEKLLQNARNITTGKLLVVFGCGGNRDTTKRPLMGRIAARLADSIFITSDNPRNEDPEKIIEEIAAGAGDRELQKIVCRRSAIRAAIHSAKPGDTVVIAGKGHENTQEISGVFHPFSDRNVVEDILQKEEEA